jgi:hypothetical protein
MKEIDEIDAQIEVLLQKRKILKEEEMIRENKPFIDRLGREVFDLLDSVKGFGPGKMSAICSMKDITIDILKKKFPLLSKLNEHDTTIIITAINK